MSAAVSRSGRIPALVAVLTALVLCADARWPGAGMQAVLAAAALLTLLALGPRLSPTERRTACICMAVGTVVELFGSQLWGVYHYRLGNIPWYVPPGHALVCIAALRLAATRLFTANPQRTIRIALIAAAAWAVAGVSIIPLLGGRMDVFGAAFFVYFAVFLRRTRRGVFFAAIFVATSGLELLGTFVGDWTWVPRAPGIGLPVGNPPSVIAGAYGVLDAAVILLQRLRYATPRSAGTAVAERVGVA